MGSQVSLKYNHRTLTIGTQCHRQQLHTGVLFSGLSGESGASSPRPARCPGTDVCEAVVDRTGGRLTL